MWKDIFSGRMGAAEGQHRTQSSMAQTGVEKMSKTYNYQHKLNLPDETIYRTSVKKRNGMQRQPTLSHHYKVLHKNEAPIWGQSDFY